MNLKKTKVNDFVFFYRNEEEFEKVYGEIFKNEGLLFSCSEKRPLIFDCGSHIGIATIYFKMKCPDAEIFAFEPDINNCKIFKKNIEENCLKNITLVNAALASFEGKVKYYGEIESDSPDTRGNSVVEAWGNKGTSDVTVVDTVRLSSYIKRPISFLKMDIEGSEIAVLKDIENQLSWVKELYVEFHETNYSKEKANLEWILSLLRKKSFEVRVIHTNLQSFLPEKLKSWIEKVDPSLTIIRATNLESAN